MELKKGIDLGNGYANFGVERFASKIKEGTLLNIGTAREEVHQVHYNGKEFIVGEGKEFIGADRYFSKEYEICLLTAIALSSFSVVGVNNILKASICVGLPIEVWQKKAKKLKEHILNWGVKEITVDGKEYVIEVKDVFVYIEGALIGDAEEDELTLTIDIGYGTVNVVMWEGSSPIAYKTITRSFNKLHSNLAQLFSNRYQANITSARVEKAMQTGFITVNQEKIVVIDDIESEIDNTVTDMVSTIRNHFEDIESVNHVKIFGGGATDTFRSWKKYFPKAQLIKNSQFVNSELFQEVVEEQTA